MAASILTFNGLDSDTDLGLIPVSVTGMLGSPAKTLGLLDIPQAPGGIDPGLPPKESARTLTIEAMVQATSQTVLMTTLDSIKDTLGTGLVEIAGPYSTTRAYYGVLQPFDAEQFTDRLLNGWARVSLSFVCPLPYAISTTRDTIAFGATAVSIPLGTAPSTGRDDFSAIIQITGAATTPTLTYLDSAGNTVSTMVFSGYSPSAGDSILIDCGRRLVYRYVSGTRSNAFTYLTAGYTFPALDPQDGSYRSSLYPSLKVSSGSAFITYNKLYR